LVAVIQVEHRSQEPSRGLAAFPDPWPSRTRR
jgi:hypothetical protein